MPKRSSKKRDINIIASSIVREATSNEKNPYAVALGRLGGLKGGVARANSLTAKRRREIAKKAAQARWGKADKTR